MTKAEYEAVYKGPERDTAETGDKPSSTTPIARKYQVMVDSQTNSLFTVVADNFTRTKEHDVVFYRDGNPVIVVAGHKFIALELVG